MTTISGFHLSILCFHLKVLINCLFLFEVFYVFFKKSSRFLSKLLFRIRFEKISYCLASDIVFVFFGFGNIRDKEVSRCVQYQKENVIESFIILSNIGKLFLLN